MTSVIVLGLVVLGLLVVSRRRHGRQCACGWAALPKDWALHDGKTLHSSTSCRPCRGVLF